MADNDTTEVEITDDIGRFAETYSSFNKIINKTQRQYLSLRETYMRQSAELQEVNRNLQDLMKENRAVTEYLNSILNSLSSGVIAVDDSGRVSHMNPAARKILGIDDDDYNPGRLHYDDVITESSSAECSALETIKTGCEIENHQKVIKTRTGNSLNLSISTSLLKNRSGETVGAVELFHDISKLKRMEQQLAQMKVLASLGEMAASIAHEIRNPLVGVGGFASLLSRDLEHDPKKKEMAKKIVEGVDSINSTIQTLLDFARNEKVEKETVDLHAYLDNTINTVVDELMLDDPEKRIKRDFSIKENINIDIDRQLFKQSFGNLLKNGLEVGDGRAVITISTKKHPLEFAQKEYSEKFGLSATETIVEILIEDDGPGIPDERIKRLFSPFYSTKENGIGLGLSIALKIIKAHGGDISVKTEVGKGTIFRVLMPAEA